MSEDRRKRTRVSRHIKRVPDHVRRMPEHIKRVPVKKAAKASGSVAMWLSFFALILVCIGVSVGRWWAPVYVETHRAELLERISAASGVEIVSDDMTLVWSRWGPRLQLTGLRVRGEDGEIPASLDKAHFSVNVFKMLVLQKLIIDDVEVEGLHLDVLRNTEGQWRLALSSEDAPQQEGRDWFEVLSRFRWLNLKDSVITFRDHKRGRQYVVDGVTVVANHFDDRYRISIDGDLPAHLGKKLSLKADLSGVAGNALSGQMYIGMEGVNLTEVGSVVGNEQLEFSGRMESLEYWQRLNDGQSTNGELQFSGEQLYVKQPEGEAAWAVDFAELAMGWERDDQTWDFWVNNLTLASEGRAWKSGFSRIIRRADGSVQAQGEQLRLGSISLLLAQLSKVKALESIADAAARYNPQGDLVSWRLFVEPEQSGPPDISFEGLISGLSVEAVGNNPGVEGLDALVRIRDKQLSARIDSRDLRFDAPKLFEAPLQFDSVQGVLLSALDPDAWSVSSDKIDLMKGEAQMQLAFQVDKPADYPGLALNIRSNFSDIDAAVLPAFYPTGIMLPGLSKWLLEAIEKGHISAGDFVLKGYSGDFPFREDKGLMRARLAVDDFQLNFSPGWPGVSDAVADVEITGKGLSVEGVGKFDGVPLEHLKLEIPDYRAGKILINTALQTDGKSIHRFASSGPLADVLATHFEKIDIEGPVHLKLAPVVALKKGDKSTIKGVATFTGGRLNIDAASVDLRNVSGKLPFDEQGLKDATIKAELFGRPLTANLKRLADGKGLQIDTRAVIPPASWLKLRDNPLADYVSGAGQLRVLVRLLNGPVDGPGSVAVSLTSDMKGIRIHAPAPVAKENAAIRPFHLEGKIDAADHSRWDFTLGENLGGKFALDAEGNMSSLALGSGVAVPTMPQLGTRIRVDWARADIARWYDFVDACCMQEDGDGSYLDAFVSVDEARWMGAPVGSGNLTLIDDNEGLQGRIDSRVAAGNFHYDYAAAEPSWDIDLQQLNITPFVEAEGDLSEGLPVDPRTVAATRWNIEKLQLSDMAIENIKIETSPVPSGMRVDRIIVSTPDYTGNGKGLWQLLGDGQHSSELEMFLHANDLGAATARLGKAQAITGGRGQVTLNLLWNDALYLPDIEILSGDVKLEMAEGRINEVDPGAGRLFGLLALQTLPQRLALDFSDLSEGLSYTQVKGEFELADGMAKTRYLVLEGPIGAVSVSGTIDYVNKVFDEQIVILPNVGGSLPVIGAVVGGPVTAAGVFLADKIFRSIGLDVNKFGRRDYALKGTFDAPELIPLSAKEVAKEAAKEAAREKNKK